MGITKVQVDALVGMAKYCDECHEALTSYTPSNAADFKPVPATFGAEAPATSVRAVEDRGADGLDIVYRFKPMTPKEWEEETGKELPPQYDPTRPIDPPQDPEDIHTMRTKGPNWHDFYAAGGKRSGGEWYETTAGDAPWAKPLANKWHAAVDDRLWEAGVVRRELRFLIAHLIKASEEYPEVDLENEKALKKYAIGA